MAGRLVLRRRQLYRAMHQASTQALVSICRRHASSAISTAQHAVAANGGYGYD